MLSDQAVNREVVELLDFLENKFWLTRHTLSDHNWSVVDIGQIVLWEVRLIIFDEFKLVSSLKFSQIGRLASLSNLSPAFRSLRYCSAWLVNGHFLSTGWNRFGRWLGDELASTWRLRVLFVFGSFRRLRSVLSGRAIVTRRSLGTFDELHIGYVVAAVFLENDVMVLLGEEIVSILLFLIAQPTEVDFADSVSWSRSVHNLKLESVDFNYR